MGYAGVHACVGTKHVNCMLITVYEGQREQANMPITTGLQASLSCHLKFNRFTGRDYISDALLLHLCLHVRWGRSAVRWHALKLCT